jgi:LacI family transcriptional regulator
MTDVAQAAGVSLGTVSNVLNHPHKVSAATSERVRAAISQLGFVRNDAARSLASGSNHSIGMLLADIDNSLFVDMAHGAQAAAGDAGLNLLLANTLCSPVVQDQYLDLFDQARVSGLLLAPMEDSMAGIERMRAHGRQIVLLNYAPEPDTCCAVLVDNEAVGRLAATHLMSIGCRRLAFVAAKDDYQPVRDRRRGILDAVHRASDGVSVEEVDSGGLTVADGERVGSALADRPPHLRPDGIIAVTDALAQGLIGALHVRHAIAVPDDIAVVGCEDNRSLETMVMPLTTLHMPGREMGEAAIALLLEEIADPGSHAHRTVVLQPQVLVRRSSARAAGGRGGRAARPSGVPVALRPVTSHHGRAWCLTSPNGPPTFSDEAIEALQAALDEERP